MTDDATPVARTAATLDETTATDATPVAPALAPGTGARGEAEKMYRSGRYSHSEIAGRLGLNVGTVKSWIARGKWAQGKGVGNLGNKGTGSQGQPGKRGAGLQSIGQPNSLRVAKHCATAAPELEDPAAAEIARVALDRLLSAKIPQIKTFREWQIVQGMYDKATGRDKATGDRGRGLNILILNNGSPPATLPAGTVTDAELLPE